MTLALSPSPPVRSLRCCALALMACLAASPAQADEPLWELGLGFGALRLPHYRGSEQSHDWLLPVPFFVYRGEWLKSDREGTRAVLLDTGLAELDLSVGASPPTRSAGNRARAGMPDLAPTFEIGPNLSLRLARGDGWKVDLRLPLRAVLSAQGGLHGQGLTFSPVLNLDIRAQGWNIGLQGGPLAASGAHHAYYYSVDPAFASAQRPAYRAGGGYAGWNATLSASRRLADGWVAGFVRSDSVAGASFADSPLVTRRHQFIVGAAVTWVFKVSDERVASGR